MNELDREILIRAHIDVIQLAEVISVAHFVVGVPLGEEMFRAVEDFAESVIGDDLMVVGDLDLSESPQLVAPWTGDIESVVGRIISSWKSLGRKPTLSEVCWFDLTEHGEQVAEELYCQALRRT